MRQTNSNADERLTMLVDGAQLHAGMLDSAALRLVEAATSSLPRDRAGLRLHGIPELTPLLTGSGPIGLVAASHLAGDCKPVRAILFDKSAQTNWALGWHQDRTIAVARRVDVPGYGPWSMKGGMVHVEPPFELLSGMVTLRVHLDPVPETNAPLLIAPGSHRLGRVPEAEIGAVVARCGPYACLAEKGDIWAYATPILHASNAASNPTHRRVLQVDYAACDLPAPLEWLGV